MRRTRLLLVVPVAATLAVGCGGSDDETSGTVTWADGVCTSIATWQESVSSAVESMKGSGADEDRVQSAVDDFKDATSTLADDLDALDRPETDAGAEAEEALETLAADLEREVDTIEEATDDVSGASETLAAVATVSAALVTIGDQVESTFDELEQLDASGELEDAFEQAGSCDDLTSSSS